MECSYSEELAVLPWDPLVGSVKADVSLSLINEEPLMAGQVCVPCEVLADFLINSCLETTVTSIVVCLDSLFPL